MIMCENKLHLSKIASVIKAVVPTVRTGLEMAANAVQIVRPEVAMGLRAASAGAAKVQAIAENVAKAEKAVKQPKRK